MPLAAVFVTYLEKRPALSVWHRAELDAEFATKTEIEVFEPYLALQDRLFGQVDERIYDPFTFSFP